MLAAENNPAVVPQGKIAMGVLIIGAGIGGLTLGLMLHRAGIDCRVFEVASSSGR